MGCHCPWYGWKVDSFPSLLRGLNITGWNVEELDRCFLLKCVIHFLCRTYIATLGDHPISCSFQRTPNSIRCTLPMCSLKEVPRGFFYMSQVLSQLIESKEILLLSVLSDRPITKHIHPSDSLWYLLLQPWKHGLR